MNPFVAATLSAAASGGVAYVLGWLIHRKPVDVAAYMAPVVPIAEFEANERRLRRIAFDANRTALPNPESGPPARITQARMAARPDRRN
jgi:hypothetical protein